jgi:WD40 repeat protein
MAVPQLHPRLWQGVLKLAHGPNAIFTAAIGKGNILATGGGDNNLKLWEIVGEEAPLATLSSHSGDVVSCAFRPNSRWADVHGGYGVRYRSGDVPAVKSEPGRVVKIEPGPSGSRVTGVGT